MNEIDDAQRLESRGFPITLIDGRVVRLRFGAKAIRYLEREYGGISAFEAEAQKGMDGRGATAMIDALIAGLLHLRLGTVDEVEDLLDENRFDTEYGPAFVQAWAEGTPPKENQSVTVKETPIVTGESLGLTSITSSQSNLAEMTTHSGI